MFMRLIIRLGVFAIDVYMWLLCLGALIIARHEGGEAASRWLDAKMRQVVDLGDRGK